MIRTLVPVVILWSSLDLPAQSAPPAKPAEAAVEKVARPDPLATGRKLATTTYAGWTYGSGEQATTKTIDCTCFIAAVCEQLARDCGKPLTKAQVAAVKIANLSKEEAGKLQQLVSDGDGKIRGVAAALVDAGLGQKVDPKDAKPGDLVQYWYRNAGGEKWLGHAAMVESITDGKALLFGSHATTLQARADGKDKVEGKEKIDVSKGGIGSGPEFNLADASRQVFVVRWTAAPPAPVKAKD